MLKRHKGFTLIELMITVAIAAIVLAIAIPSFTSQIANNRSAALGEDFATAVNFVRSEAVKRRARISLCASSNGTSCTGTWTQGFIAFVDTAVADTAAAPIVGTVLKVWRPSNAGAVITVSRGAANPTFFRYTSLGTLALITNFAVVVDAYYTGCKNNSRRSVTVGIAGLVSVARTVCP
jgi:type IV fimbrial biogenesis protein FimT